MLEEEDARLTKRLLAVGDPTSEKALDNCRAEEVATEQQMRTEETARKFETAATTVSTESREKGEEWKLAAVQSQSFKFGKCGSKHAPRRCLAWRKTCQKCQSHNHFSNMCNTKSQRNRSTT